MLCKLRNSIPFFGVHFGVNRRNSEMGQIGFDMSFDDAWARVKQVTGWKKYADLAHFIGTTPQSISGIKSRGTFPLDWAYKIAQSYQSVTDWIMTGEGPMRRNKEEYQLAEELKNADMGAEQLVNQALTIARNAAELNADLVVQIIKNMTEGRSKTELAEIDAVLIQAAVDTMKRQDKERKGD